MNVPLLPRKTFFGNPDHALVRISPDGRREPAGDDFKGSSHRVVVDSGEIEGIR